MIDPAGLRAIGYSEARAGECGFALSQRGVCRAGGFTGWLGSEML